MIVSNLRFVPVMTDLSPPALSPTLEATGQRRGLALVALAAIIWSTGGLIVRSLEAADVWTTVFWRGTFAALFLFAFVAVRDRGGTIATFRSMGWPGLIVAVCFAASTVCFIIALSLTTVANTLIIFSTAPLFATVLGLLVLGERVRASGWLTMIAALIGVAIMTSGSEGRGSVLGDMLALVIAVTLAISIITIRKHREVRMTPAACLAAVLAAAVALPMASPLSVTGGDFGLLFLFGAAQLGVGMALFTTGARWAPAAKVALLTVLETILGPIWVWLIFGEYPGALALLGGAIVLSALAAHMLLDMRRARAIPPAI